MNKSVLILFAVLAITFTPLAFAQDIPTDDGKSDLDMIFSYYELPAKEDIHTAFTWAAISVTVLVVASTIAILNDGLLLRFNLAPIPQENRKKAKLKAVIIIAVVWAIAIIVCMVL